VDFLHDDKLILKDVNMEVRPGELVALVGRSGSGKSTLLDLLCGFTRPQVGEIRVWGQDPAGIRYEDWLMPQVSLLRPESVLITGSVASNIALLEETPDRERITVLVKRVGLEEILGPHGLDTPIQSRGANLSAGQRQRLLLARALYKSPALLILDEPTSNLDSRTEHDINQLLASLKGSITMVVVSHRGNLLKEADRIYRIKGQTLAPEKHIGAQLHRS
jgi:ATP-binding cassette subfamily B protein